MKPLIYTQEYLSDLGACDPAAKWAANNIAQGTLVTREILESVPDPLWVWWLACRLDTKHELVWLAPNVAFREAAKTNPKLAEWAGKITADNWHEAAAAVWAAAADAGWAAAAVEAVEAMAMAAKSAETVAARSAAAAAGATAAAAVRKELATAAIQWLVENQYIV